METFENLVSINGEKQDVSIFPVYSRPTLGIWNLKEIQTLLINEEGPHIQISLDADNFLDCFMPRNQLYTFKNEGYLLGVIEKYHGILALEYGEVRRVIESLSFKISRQDHFIDCIVSGSTKDQDSYKNVSTSERSELSKLTFDVHFRIDLNNLDNFFYYDEFTKIKYKQLLELEG